MINVSNVVKTISKKRSRDNDIVSMKINLIKPCKKQNSKNNQKRKLKSRKKYYNYNKKSLFT